MPAANGQAIRDLYDAFARGDVATVVGAFHPNIVWLEAENIAYADRNPYIGPQAIVEGVFGRLMQEWEGFTLNPLKYVEEGDNVVCMGRYRATHRPTGLPLDAQFVHAWTLREGRIVAFQQYADTAQFARIQSTVPLG